MADETPGVVITGAAGDMGAAAALSFQADGWKVFCADIRKTPEGTRLVSVPTNVADRDQVFALARRAAAESDLKVWINGAGIVETAAMEDPSPAVWDRIIAVNLTGTFHGCVAALDAMRRKPKPGGRIVNVGSISGQLGGTGPHPAYGASKAGVHALTKSYALAGARYGIYCNAIAPSVIEGSMARSFSPRQLEKVMASLPLRRLATMDEIVHAIRYLADERAGYTNGVVLQLNGGALMTG